MERAVKSERGVLGYRYEVRRGGRELGARERRGEEEEEG